MFLIEKAYTVESIGQVCFIVPYLLYYLTITSTSVLAFVSIQLYAVR